MPEEETQAARPTRKGSPPLKVYCLPEEREAIQKLSRAAGLPVSSYLLTVGQGYPVRSVVDYEQVRELARINGDLGRLGGLLKLWLSDDERARKFGPETIRAVLRKIESNQYELETVMRRVIQAKV